MKLPHVGFHLLEPERIFFISVATLHWLHESVTDIFYFNTHILELLLMKYQHPVWFLHHPALSRMLLQRCVKQICLVLILKKCYAGIMLSFSLNLHLSLWALPKVRERDVKTKVSLNEGDKCWVGTCWYKSVGNVLRFRSFSKSLTQIRPLMNMETVLQKLHILYQYSILTHTGTRWDSGLGASCL